MLDETKKLYEQIDELMELACKQMGFKGLKDLTTEDLNTIKLVTGMMETAKELSMQQAKAMEKIDELEKKLDLLLAK